MSHFLVLNISSIANLAKFQKVFKIILNFNFVNCQSKTVKEKDWNILPPFSRKKKRNTFAKTSPRIFFVSYYFFTARNFKLKFSLQIFGFFLIFLALFFGRPHFLLEDVQDVWALNVGRHFEDGVDKCSRITNTKNGRNQLFSVKTLFCRANLLVFWLEILLILQRSEFEMAAQQPALPHTLHRKRECVNDESKRVRWQKPSRFHYEYQQIKWV